MARLPRPRAPAALTRLTDWWSSPGSGPELTSLGTLIAGLTAAWVASMIYRHHAQRVAGIEIGLQLVGAAIGGPLLLAKLLRSRDASATSPDATPNVHLPGARVRIALSKSARALLRNSGRAALAGCALVGIPLVLALLASYVQPLRTIPLAAIVWPGIVGTALIAIAWLGRVLPWRYKAPLDQAPPVYGATTIAATTLGEAVATATAVVCFVTAYALEFLSLYHVTPFH